MIGWKLPVLILDDLSLNLICIQKKIKTNHERTNHSAHIFDLLCLPPEIS